MPQKILQAVQNQDLKAIAKYIRLKNVYHVDLDLSLLWASMKGYKEVVAMLISCQQQIPPPQIAPFLVIKFFPLFLLYLHKSNDQRIT